MSETIGTFDMTCGQCGSDFDGTVFETDRGRRLTGCPDCGETCLALGIDESEVPA
jgi:DNA-directed RNA polymerase subunit RPC12/RpoP